jgi:hypothetical protein
VDTMVIPPDRIEAELLEAGAPSALAAARERSDGVSRARLAATIFALIAIAVALLVWGLLR